MVIKIQEKKIEKLVWTFDIWSKPSMGNNAYRQYVTHIVVNKI